jgi:predicted DCC family thiol-disulfide oxidoreductase YuxK
MSEHEPVAGPLIVFDGVCVLCTAWLRFVLKNDLHGEFKFATIQSPAGRQLLTNNGLDPDDPESFLLLLNGQPFSDSAAMIRVVSDFGGAWRAVKVLYLVPGPIRDWMYRLIARHRYRLFGKHDACIVPDESIADRFVQELEDLQ